MMKNRTTHTKRRGFSLLELLAVMSIMAMLTTLAVTSYFSAIRGMTRRSAIKHLSNTLTLARQRACMEGTRVSVMVFNEVIGYEEGKKDKPILVPSYVVCKEAGRISFISGRELIDEFAPLDKMFGTAKAEESYLGSIRLYNLTRGKWSNVYPSVTSHPLPNRKSAYREAQTGAAVEYKIPAYAFVVNEKVPNVNEATWSVGESYGLEAAPILALPRGFQFEKSENPAARINTIQCVTFQPDGSAAERVTINLYESQAPKGANEVTVETDGSIKWTEKWKRSS